MFHLFGYGHGYGHGHGHGHHRRHHRHGHYDNENYSTNTVIVVPQNQPVASVATNATTMSQYNPERIPVAYAAPVPSAPPSETMTQVAFTKDNRSEQLHQLPPPPPPPSYNEVARLPKHWEQATTREGRVYYVNHRTKMTSWDRPV